MGRLFPFMKRHLQRWSLLLFVLALGLMPGCTTNYYRNSADQEAYKLIKNKTPSVQNMDEHFTIEQTNQVSAGESRVVVTNTADYLGADGEKERGAQIFTLEKALETAVNHSRTYQSRKEQLYLSALELALARHQFTPLFAADGSASIVGQTEQMVDSVSGGTNAVASENLVEKRRVEADGSINVSWLIRDVGRLSAAFTTDFVRVITRGPHTTSSSRVLAMFARPLLRNAGFQREKEVLTQAERDLLYALREFTRFRKTFSVEVATSYYRVLGTRDTVRNSFLNLQSSKKNAERTRALAQEGRVTQADLGRLEQQELSAESSWINAVRNYKEALDNFKLDQLGLPVDIDLVLDDRELEALEIRAPKISVDDSIKVALAARLDYMNFRDRHDDALRNVKVAANFLKPQVDFVAEAGFNSTPDGSTGFPVPDPKRYHWSAGLDVDPGLDRKSERNSYRSAIITEKQAARALEQQADEIKLQVRDSWRTLDQAKRNYEISEVGVKIAERRVEEQNLLAELGRAKAQDQVDAQNALNDSKNQRTQALVTHTITRLQFWNNLGILYIKDNGQWEEIDDGNSQ